MIIKVDDISFYIEELEVFVEERRAISRLNFGSIIYFYEVKNRKLDLTSNMSLEVQLSLQKEWTIYSDQYIRAVEAFDKLKILL